MKARKLLFLLILLIVFPCGVLALEGTTGRLQRSQFVEPFSVGSVSVNNISLTSFDNFHATGVGGYVLLASVHNYYTMDV